MQAYTCIYMAHMEHGTFLWLYSKYNVSYIIGIVYAVKLIDSAVSVDEAGGTMPVCAVLTGSYEGIIDNITVTLRFTDSLLAGNMI